MPDFAITPEKRASQRAFFKRQLFFTPPAVLRSEVDLHEKTVIVTGSSTGIGLECARQFLDLGIGRLILAVRSESKGETARDDLLAGRNADEHTVEIWPLDLAKFESVTSFAQRAKGLERLDILVNNAGLTKLSFERNKNTGHEETVQVNYLSLALLTVLLLPTLKQKNSPDRPGRIVMVNSDVASWAKFKEKNSIPLLAALDKESNFDNQDTYYTSKLLCQLFLSELAKRVPPCVAIINAPNPGLCKSGLQREFNGTVAGFLFGIFKNIFARTVSVGARTLIDAAVKHGQESHGQYLEDCKIQPMAPLVHKAKGIEIAERLWRETLEELEFAKAGEIIDSMGTN
ncbi:Uu.00g133640.m01.CDS01 [Anthostomella pinea]|uniref:Uu.00g133640.m01.CDS01 n=1 Tax=Anthostomella pinea TaxID=933095 RepID=A0AAI8VNW0_9PEZI|nr:Uu.00g133640.m01.CDS01 [Anthostomella pinea]